jgi:trimeric autotransporter adhesin
LFFGDLNLGESSYLVLTSEADGSTQILDAERMKSWGNSSAYFNGDKVDVQFHVAPRDREVYFDIDEVLVGDSSYEEDEIIPRSICGLSDDRVVSSFMSIGRVSGFIYNILPPYTTTHIPFCTGWIASNGAMLSAGHCFAEAPPAMGGHVMEFNVPLSDENGDPVWADADDQYLITYNNVTHIGPLNVPHDSDWAVFPVEANSNTGMTPVEAYGQFIRVGDVTPQSSVFVIGYGVDADDPEYSNAQQLDEGSFIGISTEYGYYETRYRADTYGHSSGSPIWAEYSFSTGIHTDGECIGSSPETGFNYGTSFQNTNLANNLASFQGNNVVYVDASSYYSNRDGTVLRPWATVSDGESHISGDDAVLSIVAGDYHESVVFDQTVTIRSPVGRVRIIGQ